MRSIIFGIALIIPFLNFAQEKNDEFLKDLLWKNASPRLRAVLEKPDSFRYQIIYSKIDRDSNNFPHITNYNLRVNKDEYFNPASTVKMPLAFLALEKINNLSSYDVRRRTAMYTDSAYSKQTVVNTDTSAENGLPSVEHYIKKIFLVSDNDAYNRLYEFLGQAYINDRLWDMGYDEMRITRRFTPMTEEENRHTNPVRFMNSEVPLYNQPAAFNRRKFNWKKKIFIGRGHYDRNEKYVDAPMEFTTHNNAPLEYLQQILQSVIFPESVENYQRFGIKEEDYPFLYRYMSELPSESKWPRYDTSKFFDSYTKFMYKEGKGKIPSDIRIFNKTGWSYGFLTDVAYVADFKNNIEFMLSAVIYVNSDGILNDDKYDYETIGYPFFSDLRDIIMNYELNRDRKHKPDLSKFKLSYTDATE